MSLYANLLLKIGHRQAGRLGSTSRRAGKRRARSQRTLRFESLEGRKLLAADGGETLVNITTADVQQLGRRVDAIAMSPNGSYAAVWESIPAAGSPTAFVRLFNADGSPRTGEIRVNQVTVGQQNIALKFDPTIAMDQSGNFVVAFKANGATDSAGIYARRFNAAGAPLGNEFLVNAASTITQDDPALAMAPDGKFVVTWTHRKVSGGSTEIFNDSPEIYGQRFSAAGAKVGKEFVVNPKSPSSRHVSNEVAMDDAGNFAVGWIVNPALGGGSGNLYVQRFNSSGAKLGSPLLISDPGDFANGVAQSLDYDGAGNLFVAWQSNAFRIATEVYNSSGAQIGGPWNVGNVNANQSYPSIAVDNMGNFVVAWVTQEFAGGERTGIEATAQRFLSGGLPDGSEFRVNTTTNGDQLWASAAMTVDGTRAVVAWEGPGAGDDAGVFMQRYSFAAPAPLLADQAPAVADATPGGDREFALPFNQGEQKRMDLLTVVMHELGHLFGHEHDEVGVMAETLIAGERRTGLEHDDVAPADQVFGQSNDPRVGAWLGAWLNDQLDASHGWAKRRR
ncbi:MAG: matrixin family metalloprotease [Pirellula sp.]